MDIINRALIQSIKENKWVAISYDSPSEKKETRFWIHILDIYENKRFKVQCYNHSKSDNTIEATILFDNIKEASLLDFTSGSDNSKLVTKLESHYLDYPWFHYENFSNNILSYILECSILDSDPFQSDYQMVDKIDYQTLKTRKKIYLDPIQIDQIVKGIYQQDQKKYDNQFNELVISLLSIDEGDKKYVFAYQNLFFDPSQLTLELKGNVKFNQTFISDGRKHSLSQFTELTSSEFTELFLSNPEEAKDVLASGIPYNMKLDDRPDIMVLQRQLTLPLSGIIEKINVQHEDGSLCLPLKAFFGDITVKDKGKSKPKIVLYDKRVNTDQMLSIYYAMKDPVTYVQGPPGTGKTQTLFNVIVTAYFNQKTTLVSTMNNIPLDGIIEKLKFNYRYGKIPFPYLRLGNQSEVIKATSYIRTLFETKYKGTPDEVKIRLIKQKTSQANENLVEQLTQYQLRKSQNDRLEFLKKIDGEIDSQSKRIQNAINDLNDKLTNESPIKEQDILASFSPASEDSQYLSYLYFSSINRINQLKREEYQELKEIVFIEDDLERATSFNKWLKKDENIKLLTNVFPIIFTTNISAGRLGTGDFRFDLLVMDEAGQCSIGPSLLPLSRANSLLMVGDIDQLQPVVTLLPETNDILKKKYKVNDNYDYIANSIMKVMDNADKVSSRVLLKNHYRCGEKIINFSNEYFYKKQLHVDENTGPGNLEFYDCHNNYKTSYKNQAYEEAEAVVNFIKRHKEKHIVVITPFVNQANLINSLIKREGIKDVKACTIHSMQGGEEDTVLLSTGISRYTSKGAFTWLDNHKEIVNVAISRAKKDFVLFSDKTALKASTSENGIWNQLVDYTSSKGNIEVVPSKQKEEIGLSNGSITEDEFYTTLSQIAKINSRIRIKRNQKMAEVFPKDKEASNSQMEFDSIIYEKEFSYYKPIIAFEFDGGEHFLDNKRIEADKRKQELCNRLHLKLIRLPNQYSKRYEYLVMLINQYFDENDAKYEQLTLI